MTVYWVESSYDYDFGDRATHYLELNGWVQVGDDWYYMDANGAMVSNTEMVIDGRTYRFAENGAMVY